MWTNNSNEWQRFGELAGAARCDEHVFTILGERAALSPCAYLNTTPTAAAAAAAAAVSPSLRLQLL